MSSSGTTKRLAALAPYVALIVLVAGLTWVAVRADGHQSHDPELHDGGIWVTNTNDGFYGRMNKPINQLDSAIPAELGSTPDVVQDGPGVVGVDAANATISTIDPSTVEVVTGEEAGVPADAGVQLAGGTLAVVDPADGRMWGTTVDPGSGIPTVSAVDQQTDPVAELGGDATLAVSTGGTAVVLSAERDELTEFHPAGAELGDGETHGLDAEVGPGSTVTTVGETPVVLDRDSGALSWGEDASAQVAPDAVLQQPGPEADSVLVAEGDRVVEVSLETGETSILAEDLAGTPTQPVRLGACVFGAWSGAGGSVVQQCGEDESTVSSLGSNGDLVFRVNRDQIVLNDRTTGEVWDLDTENPVQIDNWEDFKREVVDSEDAEEQQEQETQGDRRPPKAEDDRFGVRPGRLTVLHPLDNDAAPQGRLLSIRSVSAARGSDFEPTVSPDGQTVQVRLPEGSTQPVTFRYVVDDGRTEVSDEASVRVTPRGPELDEPPTLRESFDPEAWTVPAGGVLDIPVLPDWRDYDDGDPLSLVSAEVEGGAAPGAEARVAGDGRIRFTAPATRGDVVLRYQVGDGEGENGEGAVRVHVQDHRAREAVAPRAQPDVVTGEVGQPILIRPLANDHPGSDPGNPDATLSLAEKITGISGARVTTDLVDGTFTMRADKPRTYFLRYQAAYGNSEFDDGTIRVDVHPAEEDQAPVAVPDQAALVGQAPMLVDVLANDVDPGGRMLTVQSAEAGFSGQLDVAVIEGRWVRLQLRQGDLSPSPQVVTYTISNGENSGVTGEIVVRQREDPVDPTPVTETDRVTVRSGSSVSVPVLDNDFSPTGAPLQLVDDVAGADPGQLEVHPPGDQAGALGAAYVSGGSVRYVAPPDVQQATSFALDYEVTTGAGQSAPGEVEVTVLPVEDNRPPEPPTLEGRVSAGGDVTVRLPGSGVDPDGDPVTLTSVSTPPQLGRVLRYGASSLVYEAFPGTVGTEEFTYTVEDDQGGTGEGTVRIAVAPPASPQAPLAVDDTAQVAPGRTLQLDALANDHIADGDRVSMELVDPPEGVDLAGGTGPISVRAPEDGGDVKIVYSVSNGVATTRAIALVRTVEGFNNPPVVSDAFGQEEEGGASANEVTVDVLKDASDPDGADEDLSITQVQAGNEVAPRVDGGEVTVPRGPEPMVVPVRVEDADGGATTASVYVPARDTSLPYGRDTIELDPGETAEAAIADHVVVPSGDEVEMTLKDRIWTAPQSGLSASIGDEQTLELTATDGYTGPAAVSFEVTTGSGVEDAEGTTSIVTVPVQIGDTAPVLRCPEQPLEIAQGQEIEVDVSTVCHTWTSNPGDADDLEYAADWDTSSDGLDIIEPRGRTISVAAAGNAAPETTGTLLLTSEGSEPGELPIKVTAQPAPSMQPVSVSDLRAGEERSIDLAPYLTAGVDDPDPQIVDVEPLSTLDIDGEADGSRLRLRAGDGVHGTARFAVTMSDVSGDDPPAGRLATSTVEVEIRDRPATPSAPVPGRTVRSQEVVLSWQAPRSNGSPIDRYRVTGDHGAGSTICGSTTCTIDGLTNGTDYTFTVEAHNAAGWSDPSPRSAIATPDAKPGEVGPIRLQRVGDGQVTLSWSPPTTDTSAIEEYLVRWPGSGEAKAVRRPQATIGGLDNDKTYAFSVVAVNALSPGPARTSSPYQSVGTPPVPNAPSLEDQETAGDTGAVTLRWAEVAPNGPGPVTYTVKRNGKALAHCTDLRTTQCDDAGMDYDGTRYDYTVTATNAGVPGVEGGRRQSSRPSAATHWEAVGKPESWGSWSVTAPKADKRAVLKYDVPDSRGRESTVKVYVDGSLRDTSANQHGSKTHSYALGPDKPHQIALQLCNENGCGATTSSKEIQTVGPLNASDVKAVGTPANDGTSDVSWRISWDSDGAPTRIEVRGINSSRRYDADSSSLDWTTKSTNKMKVGRSTSEEVRIRIIDRSGYGRSTVTTRRTAAKTPPPDRDVYVTRGSQCNDDPKASTSSLGAPPCQTSGAQLGRCTDKTCGRIQVRTAKFPSGSRVTCRFFDDAKGAWGHSETFRANTTVDASAYYGKPFSRQWVKCGQADVESNHHSWPQYGYGGGVGG